LVSRILLFDKGANVNAQAGDYGNPPPYVPDLTEVLGDLITSQKPTQSRCRVPEPDEITTSQHFMVRERDVFI
jgi:hypothetical protein